MEWEMNTIPDNSRDGFTLVELLVVIAIIGILVALLLPAVQTARESARSAQCKNHLKQISLATIHYEKTQGTYPPARLQWIPGSPNQNCGNFHPGYLVYVMPYMEQQALHELWDVTQTYGSHDATVRETVVSAFLCPTRRRPGPQAISTGASGGNNGAVSDYVGSTGDLSTQVPGDSDTNFNWGGNGNGIIITALPKCSGSTLIGVFSELRAAHVRDGLSNTLMIGEKHVAADKLGKAPVDGGDGQDGPYADGDHLMNSTRLGGVGYPIATGEHDTVAGSLNFGSWHPGVCQFALGDGSVHGLNTAIDTTILGYLSRRNDGQAIDASGF